MYEITQKDLENDTHCLETNSYILKNSQNKVKTILTTITTKYHILVLTLISIYLSQSYTYKYYGRIRLDSVQAGYYNLQDLVSTTHLATFASVQD